MAIRFCVSVACALGITAALFGMMNSFVAIGRAAVTEGTSGQVIEFVRLKRASSLKLKKRELPKRTKPKVAPSQPRLEVTPVQAPVTAAPSPAPVLTPNFTGGLRLAGGLDAGAAVSDRELTPLVRVTPMYPPRAAQRGVEGWVEVEFTISKMGTVKDPKVVEAQPSRIFNRAALRAIRKWKYKPQLINGEPVDAPGQRVRLTFDLGDEQG